MKIGIITYHRTNNYGACLQAVATRLFFEQMGHEVYYVDYWPANHEDYYKVFSSSCLKSMNIKGKIVYLFNAFRGIKEKKERIHNFNQFLSEFILPFCKPLTEHYDVVLYGSDQIWRKQSVLNAYDPVYFASLKEIADKHIAFSASMGFLPNKVKDIDTIKKLLGNFDGITVREDNLLDLVQKLGYKNAVRVIDPTLLLSGNEWTNALGLHSPNIIKPYVLVYYVSELAFDMKHIREFAQEKGLEIKVLCGRAKKSKEEGMLSTANPVLFLSLFKNASYTFVTSFHGLAFSIIFEREFYASFYSNSNRAKTLLSIVGLERRLLPANSELSEQESIDYSIVRTNLQRARENTIEVIKFLI